MQLDAAGLEYIMNFMLPIIMKVFADKMDEEYKQSFKKPCEFNDMLQMFKTLPPYFNVIGNKYPNNTDLIAYYSMQLSSGFLVNQGSLTMDCLYNMLDLQSRLGGFAVGLLDHPENYTVEAGQFGMAMKEHAKPLRNNAMLQILEFVDKYEKNNNKKVVGVFKAFNIIFIIISLFGIITNVIVVLVLKRLSYRVITKKTSKRISYNEDYISDSDDDSSDSDNTDLNYRYFLLSKRYRTRICLIIISICHLFYLKINFIVMSQFKLAAIALGHLNESQFGCKIAFFLFPPTTPYNILHQYSVWLLVYALRQHSKKIRGIRHIDDDYEFNDDTEVMTISRPESIRPLRSTGVIRKHKIKSESSNSTVCCCFEESGKNIFNCILIFFLIVVYNSQNLLFYSLNQLTLPKTNTTIEYCAFEPMFSSYYVLISQHLVPVLNLLLFVLLPMLIGILYVSFDLCMFIRLKREQNKLYRHLNEFHIEWIVYIYFLVFFVSQLPLFLHQLIDIVSQNIKFPFVFPLFIGLIFSNKVWLVIFEMSLICLAYSSNFLWWCLFDKDFISIIKFYFNKYILCKTLVLGQSKNKVNRRNELRITEMPSNSLIYKKQYMKDKMPLQQQPLEQESTSTTSTNDEKIDVIEVVSEKFNNNNNKIIDMIDDNTIDNLYQQPMQFRNNVRVPATNKNYENTDSIIINRQIS
jgi:hypothetical protein